MFLLRELALTILCGATAAWALGVEATQGFIIAMVNGMVLVVPFQAGYAIAGLGGSRARAWQIGGLGGLALVAVALSRMLAPAYLLVPLVLAAGAGLKLRRWQGAAAALYLWCVPLWAITALLGTLSGGVNLARLGAVYFTLRLLLAVAAPLRVDPWFLPSRPVV